MPDIRGSKEDESKSREYAPHSSWAGGTSDNYDLALQAEEVLEGLCFWNFNHVCGGDVNRLDLRIRRIGRMDGRMEEQ
jgi:hypothetical protein